MAIKNVPAQEDELIPLSNKIGTSKITMSSSIHKLELTNRLINCLMNDNINNIGELLNKTEYEILTIHLLGKKSLRELKEFLSFHGLKLKEDTCQ
jgi:DNA-directed RNA polymerase alpha subunit